jgi:hypothetical protein
MSIAVWLVSLLLHGSAPTPTVAYAIKVETSSWEPIAVAEVERLVEARALPALTAAAGLKLQRSGFADLAKGDYTLVASGRYVSEAETFTLYLTFGPGQRTDLPSFHTSDTVELGQRSRPEMQRAIEALAEATGKRLAVVTGPRLAASRLGQAPPPVEDAPLPWSWGSTQVPGAPRPDQRLADLVNVSAEDHERAAAVAGLGALAEDQPAARAALERCVLLDPSPQVRAACVRELEPVARLRVPTQRLLLHALRHEYDAGVLRVLVPVSAAFVGLSRKEALETWLELLAGPSFPEEAADELAELVAAEGDVPNLDLAVASCLQQPNLAWQKRHACAQWVLPRIPAARRPAVAWRYLQGVAVWDQAEELTFKEVLEALTRDAGPMSAAVAELLLDVARRPAAGRARQAALYEARQHPEPTPELAVDVVRLMADEALVTPGSRVLESFTGRHPELREPALEELKRLRQATHFPRRPGRGDPARDVDQLIRRLERQR